MEKELQVLILEDIATDAELIERELRDAGLVLTAKRVAAKEVFVSALDELRPDLILADYALPQFDGIAALAMAREKCPDVPFVFVSGVIGEELAIESLKKGATDYVLKQRLSRLVPAVRRALDEAQERRERRRAQEALRASQARLAGILDIAPDAVISVDMSQRICLFNQGAENTFGYRAEEVLGEPLDVLLPPRFREIHRLYIEEFARSSEVSRLMTQRRDVTGVRKDGSEFPAEASISKLVSAGETVFTVMLRDITARKRAEETLRTAHRELEFRYTEIADLKARLEQENIYLQQEIRTEHNFGEIVGQSLAIRKVLQAIETVAPTDATVLIAGETGTGKELIARAIHHLSPRNARALVKVNCAALPAGLIESELFGHEKGAFTGALARKIGRFELADGGTIFLDEIGDLPHDLQAKLLRVLQEQEFERIGGTQTIQVDVRVIAATNRDLGNAVKGGNFREDLYYRLNVFPILVPPLRERKEDIPLLVRYLVMKYAAKFGKRIETVPQKAMQSLLDYPWPGNVRELENVIERGVIVSRGPHLQLAESLPRTGLRAGEASSLILDDHERQHITRVLEMTGWRVSGEQGAARLLGLPPTTLESRMKKLGITRKK